MRAGAQTNRNVVLEIAGLAEEIDVLPPDEDARLLGAFTEQMTAEQLAALPDDPDELAQVLQQLADETAAVPTARRMGSSVSRFSHALPTC